MKKALISVSDKSGLDRLGRFLTEQKFEIISTGGTKKFLDEFGCKTKDISELTGFPEVLGGRVKTLHPFVHMSILAKESDEHQSVLKNYKLQQFDLVVCNLYPFEKTAKEMDRLEMNSELIEEIDIGGVTLLRASAKNFQRVVILSDPSDYDGYISKKAELSFNDRKQLAWKAFQQTSFYDSLIAATFAQDLQSTQTETPDIFPETLTIPLKRQQSLRYGENPHQKAAWYQNPLQKGLQGIIQISGKELSFNNLLDLQSCVELIQNFDEPVCVAVKHNNPCGVGTGISSQQALEKALIADPVSVFGGIVCTNFSIDVSMAKKLGEIFLECILAPDFHEDAIELLSQKKNLRLLKSSKMSPQPLAAKFIEGGALLQQKDQIDPSARTVPWTLHLVGGADQIPETLRLDLNFAEKVCAQLKSNAIAIVENGMTLGLGMGQVNRVDAVEHAIGRMKKHHPQHRVPVLASDAFFPFPDSIELIAQAGIKWVLQPGGAMKDKDVIAAAQKHGINIILTGQRHFKH